MRIYDMTAKIYYKASTWSQRSGGRGYMGISLYSRAHTGTGLAHMIEWLNEESGFDFLRIGISDTLNRFGYMADQGMPELQARAQCLSDGDKWLDNNRQILDRLSIPHEIIRWDHWQTRSPEKINLNRAHYMKAFRTHPAFREELLKDIDNFVRRKYNVTLPQIDFEKSKLCLDYLIEELAVYEEIFRNFSCTTIYPAKQLNVLTLLRSGQTDLSETLPLSPQFERLYLPAEDNRASQAA
jgi:tRNA-dependent cyclodipeptide synthase